MNKQYNLHITDGQWNPANIPIYNIEQNIRSVQNMKLDAKYNMFYSRRAVESCKHSNLCARKSSGNQVRKK